MSFGDLYSGRRLEASVIPDWKSAVLLDSPDPRPIDSRSSVAELLMMAMGGGENVKKVRERR